MKDCPLCTSWPVLPTLVWVQDLRDPPFCAPQSVLGPPPFRAMGIVSDPSPPRLHLLAQSTTRVDDGTAALSNTFPAGARASQLGASLCALRIPAGFRVGLHEEPLDFESSVTCVGGYRRQNPCPMSLESSPMATGYMQPMASVPQWNNPEPPKSEGQFPLLAILDARAGMGSNSCL